MGTITFDTNYANEPTQNKGNKSASTGSTLQFISPADQVQRAANLQSMVNTDLRAELTRLEQQLKSLRKRVILLQYVLNALILGGLSALVLKAF